LERVRIQPFITKKKKLWTGSYTLGNHIKEAEMFGREGK
jgi:hypothetical protein